MAKISTYPTIGSPSLSDILIGTDSADNNATKNFSIGDVLGLISQVYNYVPYTGATGDVDLNGYSLTVGNVTLGSSNNLSVPTGSKILLGGALWVSGGGGVDGLVLTSQGPLAQPKWRSSSDVVNTITGSFYDIQNQDVAVANTAQAVLIRQTDLSVSNGVNVVSSSRITFPSSGIYSLTFTVNIVKSGGGASDQTLDFWLKYNGGSAIANSNRKGTAQSTTHYVGFTFTYMVNVANSNEYVELMMAGTSTDLRLSYETANGIHPDNPSVSLVVSKVRIL